MRQVGTLPSEQQARRFADYLVTQKIQAHAEPDGDGWAIWVRDEEHIAQATGELKDFRSNPEDKRYAGVASRAEAVRQEELQRRRAASKNVVEMRGKWSRGMTRRAPVTFLLIAACVFVFFIASWSGRSVNATAGMLLFENPPEMSGFAGPQLDPSVFRDILHGQVWRLVTPIFLHGDALHIFFNMYMLYYFGGQFESRRGWIYFLIFIVLSAAFSNSAQAFITGDTLFGGFSGVVYALFGYIWMQARFMPKSGFFIGQITILMLIGWFFAGFLSFGIFSHIANVAHGGGLLFGVVLGYLPVMFPSLEGKL